MTLQKSPPAATGRQKKSTRNSVPAGLANVKNPLKRLRMATGLPASTLVQTVQVNYPRYDKTLQSKCERTDEYGVTLCPEAMDTLIRAYAPETRTNAPRIENRTKPCRVSCRLTEAEYGLLQLLITDKGHATMQDYLHQLLIRQIRRWERNKEAIR